MFCDQRFSTDVQIYDTSVKIQKIPAVADSKQSIV